MWILLLLELISFSFCGVLDCYKIVEGDILVTKTAREALDFRWPNAEVPYKFSYNYTMSEKQQIHEAMEEIQNKTCVRFRNATKSDHDLIGIVKERACASFVGRQGSIQDLSLGDGCFDRKTILHQLMHTLGFVHEHNRADRDEYITINWENIQDNKTDNFEKRGLEHLTLMNTPYTYNSIMHYTSGAFAKYVGNKTIVAKEQTDNMGGGEQLSDIDVERIRKLYCSDKPPPPPPTTIDGFNFQEGSGGMMWSDGCDFYGGDMNRKQGNGTDCLLYCSANPKCSHFTWDKNADICYLKVGFTRNTRPGHAESNVVCGYRKHGTIQTFWTQEQGAWWSYACDFSGNDIRRSNGTSHQCRDECVKRTDCTHFTWNPTNGGTCFLKKGHTGNPSCSLSVNICGYIGKTGGPMLCT